MSYWIKRGSTADHKAHFGGSEADSASVGLKAQFDGGTQQLLVANYRSGYHSDWICVSNMGFRDTSAWYHLVIAVDTTQGTASNRVKLYANGELLTLATATYPSLNFDCRWNENNLQVIGASTDNEAVTSPYEGYMAEMNFLDGVVATPADFGETGDYGEWKPKAYSGSYGTNGFYLTFAGAGIMSATGGDTTNTDGDYKAKSFESDGTFTPSADGFVEYLVIGGGGASGNTVSGGGGAGGYRTGYLPVTGGTAYSITVGAGGAADGHNNGGNSVFSTITSAGGGYGAGFQAAGGNGGSGGGVGGRTNALDGGSATAGQGNDGGDSAANANALSGGGGGGGAGAVGGPNRQDGGSGDYNAGGHGGNGLASSITGTSVTRAGGGGGGNDQPGTGGQGGTGGGGDGNGTDTTKAAGTANTGGGGGGAGTQGGGTSYTGTAGGSGIVIIRYKFQ
tara:strand:- start:251 stop:1603 length:1353 start_codon:yes stop_codon:yes gene_type:complete